jgi:hypothetical protein
MKYVDQACAWFLFAYGVVTIVTIELRHPPHAVLDTPFLWIFVAMFNLMRIRNDYRVHLLKAFCVAANLVVLMAEVVRWKMFGSWALIAGVPVLCEAIFSIVQRQES